MDLGSGVVSCGILTTITLVHAWNSIWYVIASVMPASVAQQLIPDPMWQHCQVIQSRAHTGADKSGIGSGIRGYSIVQIDQLLVKGSEEISSEFHSDP